MNRSKFDQLSRIRTEEYQRVVSDMLWVDICLENDLSTIRYD